MISRGQQLFHLYSPGLLKCIYYVFDDSELANCLLEEVRQVSVMLRARISKADHPLPPGSKILQGYHGLGKCSLFGQSDTIPILL